MLIGLLLGIVIGLLVSPLLRSWLVWRQYVDASREARLTDDVLERMADTTSEKSGHTGEPAETARTG
jgi:hypothetical protein